VIEPRVREPRVTGENTTPLDGGFPESTQWPLPFRGGGNVATFTLGDQATGPVVLLAVYPKGAPLSRGKAHSHRSDTFRMAVGPHHQQFKFGAKWLGHGDFLLAGANDRYVETLGTEGMYQFLVTADRRGWPHGYQQDLENDELLAAWPAMAETFFDGFWPVHERDDQAVHGIKATIASDPKAQRRVWGSFSNREGWHVLSDGSEVAVMLLADSVHGPAVILSHNQPNTVEIAPHRLGTDTFRLVLDGSVRIGEAGFGPGQFRHSSAGSDEEAVVHGPEGSNQVLVLADRASALLTSDDAESLADSTQWGELQKELAAIIGARHHD
jgi:hypothetical protein